MEKLADEITERIIQIVKVPPGIGIRYPIFKLIDDGLDKAYKLGKGRK